MAKPDYKVMVQHKTDNGTFYKQIGVGWKGTKKDGGDKVSISLHMFPNVNFYLFDNDDRESKPQTRPESYPPDEQF